MTGSDLPSLERLAARLNGAFLRRHQPIAPYTTFKIGGPADLFYDATSSEALADAVVAAREAGVPYFVLGLGANILVGDAGFRGLVIRTRPALTSSARWATSASSGPRAGPSSRT